MTQDERWNRNFLDILDFMTEQKKRPSKHRMEERQMLNWLKSQRKRYLQGKLKPSRKRKFELLLDVSNHYLRKNQYAYTYLENLTKEGFCGDLFEDLQ